MKKTFLLISLCIGLLWSASAQNLNELTATDAVTGKTMNLGSMSSGKGFVLIFHSLNCPFAKLYETRIKALKTTFQNQGIGFALINPEVGISEPEQTVLRNYIDQSGMNMSYLIDGGQAWTKVFGITKIPEIVVLTPGESGLKITYRGAIDNNPQSETAVTERHLERALNQILRKESPTPAQVRAVGCNVRTY
ncbi:thioredoxin domain-containing protein [Algoriphagus boritolerans]|uniref:AhpC/TSA family protein n=1 Tax=Algoriphagus boritolerans DSM 17298 = JCM 18970 TaxID=1120964 RepID=A0A1H5S0T8_9BACT|nr:redoxin domain-containing protein [Algoriphagus boritolerans]SEF44199.1 AhpC/TSA family protein [Algoriphagus boritolerans DSM 17298 = JCM 18970]